MEAMVNVTQLKVDVLFLIIISTLCLMENCHPQFFKYTYINIILGQDLYSTYRIGEGQDKTTSTFEQSNKNII